MATKADYPYYNGQPVEISASGWALLVASVAVAFLLLIFLSWVTPPLNFIPALLFTGVPLLTLATVTRGQQWVLFGRFGIKQAAQALGFGVLTIAVSFAVGALLLQLTEVNANPTAATLANIGPGDIVLFMVRTFIQLIGEELMTIIPLLAVLWLCVTTFGLPKVWGMVIAVVVSTAWFAAVHLPTYNWNIIQCFAGIGSARLVLTAAFLVTRKLSVAAGAHIVNDWTEFLLPVLVGGHTPIQPGA